MVRSRQAVAAGRVERGDHEFERFGQCRSVRQQRRSYAHDRRLRHRRRSVQQVDADTMKSSFIGVSALVSALAALVPAGAASAAEITYTSVGGIWHDPVDNLPGSQPADPVITNGVPTSIIRWGDTIRFAERLRLHGNRCRLRSSCPGPFRSFPWVVHASQLRGRRSFADFGSARCRARDQCRRRPAPAPDVHVHVQPRGNPEQSDAVSRIRRRPGKGVRTA